MDDYRLDAVTQQPTAPSEHNHHPEYNRVNFVLNLLTRLMIYAVVFLGGFIFAKLQTLFSSF